MLHLGLGLCFLRLPVLERKFLGCKIISNRIGRLRADEQKDDKQRTDPENKKPIDPRWLTTDLLLEWIDKEQIFTIFYGGSQHHEVIKKSLLILGWLYQNKRLPEEQIDLMWSISTKKHEAYKHVVFSLFLSLSQYYLETPDLRFMFLKVQAIAPKDQDKFSLQILKAIVKRLAPFRKAEPLAKNLVMDEMKSKNTTDYAKAGAFSVSANDL